MAWSVPKIGTVATVASGNLTLTEPTGTAQGDLQIACIAIRSTVGFTNADWVKIEGQLSGNTVSTGAGIASGEMWYRIRGASAGTLQFSRTGGDLGHGIIISYTGGNTNQTALLDTHSSNTLGSAAVTATTGTISSSEAGALLVAMVSAGDNYTNTAFDAATDPTTASGATDTTTAPTAGTWLERFDVGTNTGADGGLGVADAIRSSAGATGTIQSTVSGSARHVMIASFFKLLINTTAALALGTATLDGFAPTVTASNNQTASTALGSATLDGFAPTVTATNNQTATPGLGALTATGLAPVIDLQINTDVGALALNGFSPTVTASNHQTVTPGLGALTATGYAPWVPSSFFDHFLGSALDSTRWTSATSGGGSVSVSDSRVTLAGAGVNSDAAFFYYNQKLDVTKSQLWQFAIRNNHDQGALALWIITKSTAPTPEGSTAWIARSNLRLQIGTIGADRHLFFDKWDSGGTRTQWDHAGSAWSAPTVSAMGPIVNDDYHVVGIEIDGPGARFRVAAWAKSSGSTYSADIGLQMWALSDWVSWSAVRSSSDLWLVAGKSFTDATVFNAAGHDFEWARFADGDKVHAWTNQKDGQTDTYDIKHWWSYDGIAFMPEARAGVAISPSSGWESTNTKDKSIVRDWDGTYYMAYAGTGSGYQIGIASSPSGLDGSWTKYGSNPIIAGTGSDTDEQWVLSPYLLKDETDPDANKRWKLYYGAINVVTGPRWSIHLATAPTPLGTWTKQGELLGPGAGGAFDEGGAHTPVVFQHDGLWELWYAGHPTATGSHKWQIGRATATDPNGPFTRDGSGARIGGQLDQVQALSANLSGRTLSLTDTTGFEVDQLVVVDQDSTDDNWNLSRVRKVTTNTSLELYHALQGFTTASSAEVRGARAGSHSIHHIERVGSKWRFYVTVFSVFGNHGSFVSFMETGLLFTSTGLLDAKTIDWIDSPQTGFGQWNNKRSSENIAIARRPLTDLGIATGVGALTLTGFAPTVQTPVAVSTALGALTLNGFAPTVSVSSGTSAAPDLGAATLNGFAPTVLTPVTVSTALGELALNGLAPTVTATANVTASPGLGALTLNGLAPTVVAPASASPALGQATLNGLAPQVFAGATVTTATGALDLNGLAPTVSATQNHVASTGLGAALLNGLAPSVAISNHQTAAPSVGALALNGLAPSAIADTAARPDVGALTLAGLEPTVSATAHVTATPDTGQLTLDGLEPTAVATGGTQNDPGTGLLVLTGFAPTVLVRGIYRIEPIPEPVGTGSGAPWRFQG